VNAFFRPCPHCGQAVERFRNPAPTVDAVIYDPDRGVVLVKRGAEPFGYALPGGFVEYGESTEQAVAREALEETNLRIRLVGLLGVYSAPKRDPRSHTLSVIYTARAENPDAVRGGDDAAEAAFHPLDKLPPLVFDHDRVLRDFAAALAGGRGLADVAYPVDAVVPEIS
jgi:8-oxo-dGTP diphosphatase